MITHAGSAPDSERMMSSIAPDKDYVLGTHDDEVERLGLQHQVWRPRVLEAWRRAGFGTGQTILDVGSGPGHASFDLAEIVGPSGRVVAVDRSRRFLDALEATRRQRGVSNIEVFEIDLDEGQLPSVRVDGAWCRWVFAFVRQPRELLERVAGALKPGGILVAHEYFHYTTWRMAPSCPELEEFVQIVTRSWRATGGEPDVGLELPRWMEELGLQVRETRPIIDMVPPTSPVWRWPKAFIHVGLLRMVDLGQLTAERARAISEALAEAEARPGTRMITPAVLEIIAARA